MPELEHPGTPIEGERAPELYEGRYLLGQILGRGGTCTVQRAWDTRLNRHVAIKRLEPPLNDDAHARARFDREGKAIARLSHPNLVTLIDRGEADDGSYLVFEYVEGRSLKDLLKSAGPLEPRDAGQIAGQIAEGLAHAHSQGIVHRDVKPHNVLLDAEGRTKLTDFGIATGEEWTRMTHEGSIVGSSRYMSPEQVQGRPVDQHTDIYSLGIVLYEMLTGAPPFQGSSIAEVGRQHIRTPPTPLRELVPYISEGMERVVMRCLEKLPENRFQSADELLGALVGTDLYTQAKTPGGALSGLRRGRKTGGPAGDDAWVPPPGTETTPPAELPPGLTTDSGFDLPESRARRADIMRRRRDKRRGPSGRTLAGIAGVLVIAVAGWWLLAGRGAEAPDLMGDSLDKARTAAEAVGLKVEVVEQVLDLSKDIGIVVAQEPPAGEKAAGGLVQLTVTREPIPVKVTALDDYDPEGDNEERPELLNQLTDGNDDTGWATEQYRSAEFGNLPKTGVGVSFRLDAPATAMEVVAHSEGWGGEVQSLSADGTVTPAGALDGKTRQELTFEQPVEAGRIWITKLSPGESDRFLVQLAELRFFR
ncbi:MAG: protein kinase domain-containing protein [Thermoleophilia bacterium]